MKRHQETSTFVYYPMALPHWPMIPTPASDTWKTPSRRLEEDTRYFPDMVECMDQLGIRDETLIPFYSDNGTDRRIQSNFPGQRINGGRTPRLRPAYVCRSLLTGKEKFDLVFSRSG